MPVLEERRLSPDEFCERYAGEKPYFEYWNGEPVQKSMPTRLHSLIQEILVRMLRSMGFDAGQEIEIRLDPAYRPVPDVIASQRKLRDPYPTEPFDVVVEILSPEDSFSRMMQKCRLYEKWGIRRIAVIDPATRKIWAFSNGSACEADTIARHGERILTARELWEEADRLLEPAGDQQQQQ
jgi:Uma2 family endonuclease